jgi:hypothetical protein
MTKKDKLLERFLTIPKDFTYQELKALLNSLGYEEGNLGKTSGSRVVFFNAKIMHKFKIHKPHPINIIKHYLLVFILQELKSKNII